MAACDPESFWWPRRRGRDYGYENALFAMLHRESLKAHLDYIAACTNADNEPEFLLENGQRVRIRVKPRQS